MTSFYSRTKKDPSYELVWYFVLLEFFNCLDTIGGQWEEYGLSLMLSIEDEEARYGVVFEENNQIAITCDGEDLFLDRVTQGDVLRCMIITVKIAVEQIERETELFPQHFVCMCGCPMEHHSLYLFECHCMKCYAFQLSAAKTIFNLQESRQNHK